MHLGYEPADKALIESHVKITTTPQVEGAWAWIKHDGDPNPSLDWRPKNYWPAGTVVHVESDIYGLDFGDGYYGGDNITSDFTIGRNQVVLADANAHNIVVQQDGVTVASYDASYGSGDDIGDPNRVTRSGVHVVMDKQETTKMSNPAYGYTNITEHWAVRISDNGEFIHQNQGTVSDQGVDNVSHGCINLSAESAEAYFNSAIYGDPVEVTGTSVPLSAADGDIYDWSYTWDEWLAKSAPATELNHAARAARLLLAAAVAQSAERLTRNEKVWGSIPHSGSDGQAPVRTASGGISVPPDRRSCLPVMGPHGIRAVLGVAERGDAHAGRRITSGGGSSTGPPGPAAPRAGSARSLRSSSSCSAPSH